MKKGLQVESWKVEKLGDVCDIVNGSTPLRSNKRFWGDGNISWFTIDDIRTQGRKIQETKQKVTQLALEESSLRMLPINSVLLCCTASIGEYAITEIPLATNQQFNGLVVKNQKLLSPYFLFHYCATMKDKLLNLSGKTTIDFIPISRLREIEIPIPPLPEQQRIVSMLDEAFESIASAKSNAERNLVNARELFDSVLKEIFNSGDENWEEKRIDGICENLDSQRIPVTKRDRKEGKYPYYGASGIVDYVDKFIFNEDLLLVSEDGANLLARTYPIAFSISGKTWVNNHAHVLKFENMGTQKFVEYYLNSIPLDDYVSGMAQPKLNQAMLNSILVPLPKLLTEQRAIVTRLEALSAETKRLEEIYQQKVESLEEMRKSILQKAFAGEL